jgi:hypothetical protein
MRRINSLLASAGALAVWLHGANEPSARCFPPPGPHHDVAEWLRALACTGTPPRLSLRHLTADDLKDPGVTSIGHRRKLTAAIAALTDVPPHR